MLRILRHVCRMAAVATGLITADAASAPIEVGRPFPTIVLPAADDNRPMSVAGYRGGKLLLHLFASW